MFSWSFHGSRAPPQGLVAVPFAFGTCYMAHAQAYPGGGDPTPPFSPPLAIQILPKMHVSQFSHFLGAQNMVFEECIMVFEGF